MRLRVDAHDEHRVGAGGRFAFVGTAVDAHDEEVLTAAADVHGFLAAKARRVEAEVKRLTREEDRVGLRGDDQRRVEGARGQHHDTKQDE